MVRPKDMYGNDLPIVGDLVRWSHWNHDEYFKVLRINGNSIFLKDYLNSGALRYDVHEGYGHGAQYKWVILDKPKTSGFAKFVNANNL